MAQLFHPAANTIAKASILGGVFILAGVVFAAAAFVLSPYVTDQYVVREQPVQFSHEHHVAGLGIDCRYCHSTVEHTNYAGMPSTKTCMTCHSQIWNNAELLQPVRDSWKEGRPIQWTRVHDLPDFVQFNHSIHVQKGIGCVSCHGRVDGMPLMWQTQTLHMEWCLDCHRNPEKHVRPRDKVFDLNWAWPADKDPIAEGKKLVEQYKIATWDYPVHGRATDMADPHGSNPPAMEDGLVPAIERTERQPNPLTNCSVCHY